MEAYIVQKESLETVADSIRAKAGISGKLEFPLGWKAAVENISGGSAPDGSAVTFGYEKYEPNVPVADGKAYYNGVLLPKLPEDVLAQYPYAWIRNDGANGNYNLVVARTPWYYNSKTGNLAKGTNETIPYYSIPISGYLSATDWGSPAQSDLEFGLASNRTVIWSNHNIPNGNATATNIYFGGSKPITEEDIILPPVEREEQYAIASADLNELGAVTQKVADISVPLTVTDMVYYLNRAQNGMGTFTTSAVGVALQGG